MHSLARAKRAVGRRWASALAGVVVAGAAAATAGAMIGAGEDSIGTGNAPPPYASADSPLREAPWLHQPGGSPSIDSVEPRGSLRLPLGMGYSEALRELYVAALERGDLPEGTALEAPLPAEVVLVRSSDPAVGLRLSLTAPWGCGPEARAIRPPSVRMPGVLSVEEVARRIDRARAEGVAIPEGGEVDVPALTPCQVAVDEPTNRPPCAPSASRDTP